MTGPRSALLHLSDVLANANGARDHIIALAVLTGSKRATVEWKMDMCAYMLYTMREMEATYLLFVIHQFPSQRLTDCLDG